VLPGGHLPRRRGPGLLAEHHVGEALVLVRAGEGLAVTDLGQALHAGPLEALREVAPGGGAVHRAVAVVWAGGHHMGLPFPQLCRLPLQDLSETTCSVPTTCIVRVCWDPGEGGGGAAAMVRGICHHLGLIL